MTEISSDDYCTEIDEEHREYFELPLKKYDLERRKREYELIKESLLTDRQASELALINEELEVIDFKINAINKNYNDEYYWGLPADENDYELALKQDCWTAREAVCWLHGRNPLWYRGDINDYYKDKVELIEQAIKAEILTADGSTPKAWIQWAVSKGWELPDYISEFILTGEQIDWRYWAVMPSIKVCEAARLSLCIDPIKYPDSECFLGQLTDEVKNELRKCERWLESHSNTWTLPQLVDILGDNRSPDGMKNAAIEWEPNKQVTESQTVKTKKPTNADMSKPWLVVDPKDPESKYDWYTPARYFARKLVEEDSLLLTKRDILAVKVVTLLTGAGIKKRGGKKTFDPNTIKKSLSNIDFG